MKLTVMLQRLTILMVLLHFAAPAAAATTINATNAYSWGANFGWMDWRAGTNGAVLTDYVCAGSIYSGNVGWINLGNGVPTNGIQYQNSSPSDFGVNVDGAGNLRGYAYGANIGWINFENIGGARIDLFTGKFSGHCYSANCGWISLSNTFGHVQTDFILPGVDSDSDGMADAWELSHFGTLSHEAADDNDGDGASNLAEYFAGTDPDDAASKLIITQYVLGPSTNATVAWQSVLTRQYSIEQTPDLNTLLWADSDLGLVMPDGTVTTRLIAHTNDAMRFLRVRAIKPLSP